LPEVVPREDLQAAAALNGIEFNVARAVGPGLAGFVVAAAGVSTAFLMNAASFVGVIWVIARWKRPVHRRTSPPERVGSGMVTGLRYVRYSPTIRNLMLRTGLVTFFATALTALLPLIAHNVKNSPVVFGILLGCFGLGAVAGAVMMQRAQARWSAEVVVASGVAIYGVATLVTGVVRLLPLLSAAAFVGGASWIMFIAIINVMILNRSPDWVRARVLSVATLVMQGSVAIGGLAWGAIATHFGETAALTWAGAGTIVATGVAFVLPLPATRVDVTTWNHWPLPDLGRDALPAGYDTGPVLVTVEYDVSPENAAEFLQTVQRYERVRRRDGASRWSIYHDLENPGHYVETFIVSSWGEHLRQHDRFTQADRELEELLYRYTRERPKVRHFVSAVSDRVVEAREKTP
jgi:hypothetical protein